MVQYEITSKISKFNSLHASLLINREDQLSRLLLKQVYNNMMNKSKEIQQMIDYESKLRNYQNQNIEKLEQGQRKQQQLNNKAKEKQLLNSQKQRARSDHVRRTLDHDKEIQIEKLHHNMSTVNRTEDKLDKYYNGFVSQRNANLKRNIKLHEDVSERNQEMNKELLINKTLQIQQKMKEKNHSSLLVQKGNYIKHIQKVNFDNLRLDDSNQKIRRTLEENEEQLRRKKEKFDIKLQRIDDGLHEKQEMQKHRLQLRYETENQRRKMQNDFQLEIQKLKKKQAHILMGTS